jgi:peptidyl-prolyl cis-trans isomerase C
MLNKTSLRLPLLSLGLSLLFAGWIACKPAADKDGTAAAPGADTAASSQTATPGSQPAAPGQTSAGAAGSAGSATSAQPGNPANPANPMNPAAPANPADAKPVLGKDLPAVVAKVDGKTITREDLLQASQAVQIRLAQQGRPVTPTMGFYRQVLDEIVGIVLLQQDAKASGVTATDQEVQQQLTHRKSVFPNEEAYKQALAKAGLTETKLREQTRDQIAVQKYLQNRFAQAGNVSDQATREFYDKNKAQIQAPERVHVRHILIRVDEKAPAADKQKARQKAEDVLKRLQAGEDFAKLAQENSDDPGSKVQGGDLGWMVKGQTVPSFEQAAFALKKPNDLSPVVESQFGFHIIQLLDHQAPGAIPYEQVKPRITQLLQQQQAQQQLAARVRELRSKAKVEVFL